MTNNISLLSFPLSLSQMLCMVLKSALFKLLIRNGVKILYYIEPKYNTITQQI
jgi:hypothetical protein